ncbi:MAG: helix-turn-helix domain-containing protein [Gaiellaceae bacterium]
MSLHEARELLGISERSLYRLIRGHQLRVVRIGSRTLVEPDALRRLIESNRSTKDDDPASKARSIVTSPASPGGGDDSA